MFNEIINGPIQREAPELYMDGYKLGHPDQYPEDTELVYSNFTPRSSRSGIPFVIAFGLQYFIQEYLINRFNKEFFGRSFREVGQDFKTEVDSYLNADISIRRIKELHQLGYLPIEIKALEEGALVPLQVPLFTIVNSDDVPSAKRFFWLTNYFETILSCINWGMVTSATTAFAFKALLTKFAMETVGDAGFVPFQGHDFSFRGMFGLEAALMSGGAHLTSFCGTDTIPAIRWLKKYYHADAKNGIIGCSVNATEHSVMCAGGDDDELNTYLRLLTKVYPTGIVSIVSDTWDYWNVLTNILPKIKSVIMKREGKLVVRPDSGPTVHVIAGYREDEVIRDGDRIFVNVKGGKGEEISEAQFKGTIEVLWDIFGGTITAKGFKLLDSHIGAILGDGVTLSNCSEMLTRLREKGFASINMVFGIGSYTYQYVTRDTYGMAMKATFVRIKGKEKAIFKDPKTNTGSFSKKSARGLLQVNRVSGAHGSRLVLRDGVTWADEKDSELKTVFKNGKLVRSVTLEEIRERVNQNLNHPVVIGLFK